MNRYWQRAPALEKQDENERHIPPEDQKRSLEVVNHDNIQHKLISTTSPSSLIRQPEDTNTELQQPKNDTNLESNDPVNAEERAISLSERIDDVSGSSDQQDTHTPNQDPQRGWWWQESTTSSWWWGNKDTEAGYEEPQQPQQESWLGWSLQYTRVGGILPFGNTRQAPDKVEELPEESSTSDTQPIELQGTNTSQIGNRKDQEEDEIDRKGQIENEEYRKEGKEGKSEVGKEDGNQIGKDDNRQNLPSVLNETANNWNPTTVSESHDLTNSNAILTQNASDADRAEQTQLRQSWIYDVSNVINSVKPLLNTELKNEDTRVQSMDGNRERTPTSQVNNSGASPAPAQSWLSWLTFSRAPEVDDDDTDVSGDESAAELYKAAKMSLEAPRDSSQYAFKSVIQRRETNRGVLDTQSAKLTHGKTDTREAVNRKTVDTRGGLNSKAADAREGVKRKAIDVREGVDRNAVDSRETVNNEGDTVNTNGETTNTNIEATTTNGSTKQELIPNIKNAPNGDLKAASTREDERKGNKGERTEYSVNGQMGFFRLASNEVKGYFQGSFDDLKQQFLQSKEYLHNELAVSDTLTESRPVRFHLRKRPLTPYETLELALGSGMQPARASGRLYPRFSWNIRPITVRTKLRLHCEETLWPNKSSEVHLYRSTGLRILQKKKSVAKVVVIGVHGFLPIKFVRTIIGEPTGSSISFVHSAAHVVERWMDESTPYTIQTIALEGEGKITDRVKKLCTLLENWKELVAESDFVFMAAHSLGVPVAMHVFAEMLTRWKAEGMALGQKKLGFLSMGGLVSGPHSGLDSKVVIRAYSPHEKTLISELFELQRPNLPTSIQLDRAMRKLVEEHNVKVTCVACADDQFVPLISSLALKYRHPNIFRTVYSREGGEVPRFMVELVGALLAMINVGVTEDMPLLRAINDVFVGTSGGHCSMHQNEEVYMTGVMHAVETTSLVGRTRHKLDVQESRYAYTKVSANVYDIPWQLRSMLERLVRVKNIGSLSILERLVESYHEWDPQTRAWKDVKMWFSGLEELDLEDLLA